MKKKGMSKMYNLREAMDVARKWATFSNCNSRKIGCVILQKHDDKYMLIGSGCNTTSDDLCNEGQCRKRFFGETEHSKFCNAIHAEESAIMDAIQSVDTDWITGGIAVMTCGYPCRYCLTRLYEGGVTKLILSNNTFYTPLDERFYNAHKDWFEVEIYKEPDN